MCAQDAKAAREEAARTAVLAGEEKRAKLTAPAKKKRKKEEGEPKGVRTSYLFFCEDMREEIDTVSPDRRFEFEFERQEVGVSGSCGAGRPTRRWG